MSIFNGFNKKSKLNAMIKQTQQARHSDATLAEGLFKSAYQGYAEVLLDDPLRADALYQWGFALLHHAKMNSGEKAIELYRDALAKFDFCLLLNPNYLGAALNGGVAYMDLARLLAVNCDDKLYDLAKKQFEKANSIHKGTASYNVACIHALLNEKEACLKALEHAQANGSLPDIADILNDADMDNVKTQDWFIAFIEPLIKPTDKVAARDTVEENTQPIQTEPVAMQSAIETAVVEEIQNEVISEETVVQTTQENTIVQVEPEVIKTELENK